MKRFLMLAGLAGSLHGEPAPLPVVPSVDLNRYAGTWYEIARFPNRFQRHCAANTTATYTLRPDGKVTVLNRCLTANGETKSAKGTARLADKKGPNSKLKVTFFWPFSGDYWVIGLDPDYRWAVIGEPSRKYLWILSRDPQLPADTLAKLEGLARDKGYDPGHLIRTRQDRK